jgi:hypothetical protein
VYRRRRIAAGLIAVLVITGLVVGIHSVVGAVAGGPEGAHQPGSAGARGIGRGSSSPVTSSSPKITAVPAAIDGSLGDPETRRACALLQPSEIQAQFGGPVSSPIPMYPFCMWRIGTDAFVALVVRPHASIDALPATAPSVRSAPSLGSGAYYGSNRFLYFSGPQAAYWLLYQKVGEFTGIRTVQLESLARTVIAAGLPAAPTAAILEATAASPAPPPSPPAGPSASHPVRVYFGGDSLSAGPSWATFEAARGLPLDVLTEYQVGTGLVRTDFYDWQRHLQGVMGGWRPQISVWIAGANDHQNMPVGDSMLERGTPAWFAEYRKRVDQVMSTLTAAGRYAIWIGLPPVERTELSVYLKQLNAIYLAEAEEHPRVVYVDGWKMFSKPGGGYAQDLPGPDGTVEPVRLPDGLHLNAAGSILLGDAVVDQIRTIVALPSTGASPTAPATASPTSSPSG